MSFRNLLPHQNRLVSDLLIGVAKTVFVASVVALFFPHVGEPRPVLYGLAGMAVSAVLAIIGVALAPAPDAAGRTGPRRR